MYGVFQPTIRQLAAVPRTDNASQLDVFLNWIGYAGYRALYENETPIYPDLYLTMGMALKGPDSLDMGGL